MISIIHLVNAINDKKNVNFIAIVKEKRLSRVEFVLFFCIET